MAIDTMDIDPIDSPAGAVDLDRKRKHKHKDPSSPSKKRKHGSSLIADEATASDKKSSKKSKEKRKSKHGTSSSETGSDSPFSLTTATLYLPLSPISISPTHALASLLAEHLSPLLLTYYPPLKGIVLAYSNASISSRPPTTPPSSDAHDQNPQPLTLATTANEYGVLYVYLTATFLVFRPQRGQTLEGLVNVQSEGFLGAVVLNLFSVGIERKRLPPNWKWIPPGEEGSGNDTKNNKKVFSENENEESDSSSSPSFDPEKEHFKPISSLDSDDADPLNQNQTQDYPELEDPDSSATGYFQSVSGHRVRGTVRFRVVDIDIIPGSERDRGFISIEGTMLSPEEEAKVVKEERSGVLSSSSATPRRGAHWGRQDSSMTGALAIPASIQMNDQQAEASESPSKKETKVSEREKKSKSKSKSKKKEKEK